MRLGFQSQSLAKKTILDLEILVADWKNWAERHLAALWLLNLTEQFLLPYSLVKSLYWYSSTERPASYTNLVLYFELSFLSFTVPATACRVQSGNPLLLVVSKFCQILDFSL